MSSKNYFNKVAQNWDTMRLDFFSESLREKAIKIAGVGEGQKAADFGAGTGFMTEILFELNQVVRLFLKPTKCVLCCIL